MLLLPTLMLVLSAGDVPDVVARPAAGEPAPAFSAAATSGKTLGLADYKGKQTLVLAFFPKAFTAG